MKNRELLKLYENCRLCPRNCGINRHERPGFCGETSHLSVGSALIHHGEEPPISHKNGSGTIFFNGCSLRCYFCQNMQISQYPDRQDNQSTIPLADLMEGLYYKKAENYNFVTPDHFLPHILDAIAQITEKKMVLPVVYNCSGYQTEDHIHQASSIADIFLIDYKFAQEDAAYYCTGTRNYPEIAFKAIETALKIKGNLKTDPEGKGIKGVLIRHLVMPDFIDNSIEVINNLYFSFGNQVTLSLMCQYTPRYLKKGYERINRKVTQIEYKRVTDLVMDLGFNHGYIQEYNHTEDPYIPDFQEKRLYDRW